MFLRKILQIIITDNACNIFFGINLPWLFIKNLIDGSVATILTAGVGEAVNISCYKLYESILNGNKDIEEQMKMFGDMVQKYATEYCKSGKKPEDYKKPE